MKKKFDDSTSKQDNPYHLFSKQRKYSSAREYFLVLKEQSFTPQLKEFLSVFAEPKLINDENFVAGAKKFIELANANPVGEKSPRKSLYGTNYSGLHYNNDLAKLWNAEHMDQEPLKASEVTSLAPSEWNSIVQDECFTLIYKGQQPAQALDNLVKGPTVIDCGMFVQLSLWFGIRYMLGNERFNRCFGRAPFFITQFVFNGIKESNKPFLGNPLYSFLAKKEMATIPSIGVRYFSNTPLYRLKHPGGNYKGENCIVIGEQYYILTPHLENTQGITEADVWNFLREEYNQARQPYDVDRLSLYAATPKEFHPELHLTYGKLIEEAEKLRDRKLSKAKFSHVEHSSAPELTFDLHKFSIWLGRMEKAMQPDSINYLPKPIKPSLLLTKLLDVIPFENKTSMDFFNFKTESPQQKELMMMSKQFCQSIMACESKLVILTGKAGVGKTASAVCAAKELTVSGKNVVWISEVMVNGWADQANSMADLGNCGRKIDQLLASNPDAVFLDDDNLAGFSGNLLLEKIYSWFVSNPGKGLFITSNQPIRFDDCYGYKLDNKYYYPPFNEYTSLQYLNWQHKTDLAGVSLRSKREGQSIGAIVSDLSWKTNESRLGQIELIPGFEHEKLVFIRQSLRKTGSLNCDAYDNLRPIEKQWISFYEAGEYVSNDGGFNIVYKSYLTANSITFEKSAYKTIALEMREWNCSILGKHIDIDSMYQLIRVLNYAHDQGGRRIILINQTSFSSEQLLIKIKAKLPQSERERTWSRLELLLCETEDTIFSYDQFNGLINDAPAMSSIPFENVGVSLLKKKGLFISNTRSTNEPLSVENRPLCIPLVQNNPT